MKNDPELHNLLALFKAEDSLELTNEIKELVPQLQKFLQFNYSANIIDAEECVFRALSKLYRAAVVGELDHVNVLAYTIATVKNEYFALKKDQSRTPIVENLEYYEDSAYESPYAALLRQDQLKALDEAISELDLFSQRLIRFYLESESTHYRDALGYFKMTHVNLRTRKSRIVKVLKEKVLKKLAR